MGKAKEGIVNLVNRMSDWVVPSSSCRPEELEPWAVPPSIAEVQVKTASNALLALDVAGAENPDRECETPSEGVNAAATADWATIQPLQRSVTPGRLRTQRSAPRRLTK